MSNKEKNKLSSCCYFFLKDFILGVTLFKLESLVFQVKVGVALFDLESLGPIYIPPYCIL